jgi:hypothetical protein
VGMVPLPTARESRGKNRWLLVAVLVVLSFVSIWSAYTGERYVVPLKQAITNYVAGDNSAVEFFRQRGLLLSPAQQRRCVRQTVERCRFDANQERWLRQYGVRTYQSWLLQTFPERTVVWLRSLPRAMSRDLVVYLFTRRSGVYKWAAMIAPIGRVSFGYVCVICVALATMGAIVAVLRGSFTHRQRALFQFGLLAAVAGVSNMFVAYWGDGIEVERHLVLPTHATVLGVWFALVSCVDVWLRHGSGSGQSDSKCLRDRSGA